MEPHRRSAVILFSRAPREEQVVKHLPQANGASAAELLQATRERVTSEASEALPSAQLFVVGGGPAPAGAISLAQRGACFAERLTNALADVASRSFSRIIIIPGDVPGLAADHLRRAEAALLAGHLALGPCPDGGIYLLGLDATRGQDLRSVRWCTSHVLEDLERLAAVLGVPVERLDPLLDIDRAADLRRLSGDPRLDPTIARILRALLHTPRPHEFERSRAGARTSPVLPLVPRGPPVASRSSTSATA